MFGISAFSQSPYSALGTITKTGVAYISATATLTVALSGSIIYADASISSTATLTADGLRTRLGNTSITGTATVSALGGFTALGSASVEGLATLELPSITVIRQADASINGLGTVTALGTILGEEWTDVPIEENTWSEVSASSDLWTDVPVENNTWSEVSAGSNVWTDSTVGTNKWKRQG
jgi:hypothetical protein